MGKFAPLGIGLLIAVMVVSWIALARAGEAQRAFAELEGEFRGMAKRLNEALAQIAALSQTIKNLPSRDRVSDPSTSEPSSTAPVAPAAPTHIAAAAKSAGVEPARPMTVADLRELEQPSAPVVKRPFDDGRMISEWSIASATEKAP